MPPEALCFSSIIWETDQVDPTGSENLCPAGGGRHTEPDVDRLGQLREALGADDGVGGARAPWRCISLLRLAVLYCL